MSEARPQPADHRARVAISATFFMNGAALGGYVAHLPDFQERLHLTNGQLGNCMLFSAFGAMSSMPLTGLTIHRFGSRNVTLVGGIGMLIAASLLGFAPSVPLLCLFLYLLGASNGQCDVGMNTHSMAVQDRFPKPILSAVHGWFSLGGFAGGAGVALANQVGASPAQHLVIASLVLSLVLGFGVRRMYPTDANKEADGPKFALPTRRIMLIGVLVLFAFVSEGAMWDWCSVYLRQVLHSGAVLGAVGFGIASFAMACGRFTGDRIIHRIGYRATLVGSALLCAGGILLAVCAGSVPLAIAGFSLCGVGVANLVPILFRASALVPGVPSSIGLASVTTCGYSGFLAGPPVLGHLADRYGLAFALGLITLMCLGIAVAGKRAVRGMILEG